MKNKEYAQANQRSLEKAVNRQSKYLKEVARRDAWLYLCRGNIFPSTAMTDRSPVEVMYDLGLFLALYESAHFREELPLVSDYEIDDYGLYNFKVRFESTAKVEREIKIAPQYKIISDSKVYYSDFLISLSPPGYKLIVEIDGHEFHEKTKEQAQRDRERERAIKREGYDIIRFTGSEIYRNPDKAVYETLLYIESEIKNGR